MATHNQGVLYPDELTAKVEVVDSSIPFLAPTVHKLLSLIGLNGLSDVTSYIYKYYDIQTKGVKYSLAAAITTNSQTTITLAEEGAAQNDIIEIQREQIKLGTVDSTGKVFSSCTRGHNSTTKITSASVGDDLLNLSAEYAPGSSNGTAHPIPLPQLHTNYVQTFRKFVDVAGQAAAVALHGGLDAVEHAKAVNLNLLAGHMESVAYFGVAQAPVTSGTAGLMDGLYQRLSTNASTDMSGTDLWIDDLFAYAHQRSDYGIPPGQELILMCSPYVKTNFDSVATSYMRRDVQASEAVNMILGGNVDALQVGENRYYLAANPKCTDWACVIDPEYVDLGQLKGREMAYYPEGRSSDSIKGDFTGDLTMMVACDYAHMFYDNVKAS